MSERQLQNSLVSVTTISFIIFWDFSMFYQIFLSPQVKWGAIITHKHDIYHSPHELPNNSPLGGRACPRRGGHAPPRTSPKYPMSHCSQDQTPHPPIRKACRTTPGHHGSRHPKDQPPWKLTRKGAWLKATPSTPL